MDDPAKEIQIPKTDKSDYGPAHPFGYSLEELLPIVARLSEKYTSFQSTSITYEKAEQLMGAVLYCIRETVQPDTALYPHTCVSQCPRADAPADPCDGCAHHARANAPLYNVTATAQKQSAQQAYEAGVACVEQKTKQALIMYNDLMQNFQSYGVCCLDDTLTKGIPEFFKWYDIPFNPQETILTLDYPVLTDLSAMSGVDRIYAYLSCIRFEQLFLKNFPAGYVESRLAAYHPSYRGMVENICEILLLSVVGHLLIDKPFTGAAFHPDDYMRIHSSILQEPLDDICKRTEQAFARFLQRYYAGLPCLSDYLIGSVRPALLRIRTAAAHHTYDAMHLPF